ncbi:MAG: MarR family transcriptional regulator [Eggerthellaceae bacterium]|nr:MarR family transcriptional regulator [Eggerthellaceae bacterium]
MKDDKGALLLENQLCFRLYSASKEIVRRYKPYLDPLGLTYTQYIAMMVLWAEESMNVSELGARLRLDSSTLTPLLKKLEAAGYVTRERSREDERVMVITLTDEGHDLHDRAMSVPMCIMADMHIDPESGIELSKMLDEFMERADQPE